MDTTQVPPPLPGAPSLGHELAEVNAFMRRVYNWMAGGLALTGLAAWWVSQSPAMQSVIFQPFVFFGLIIGELLLVMAISWGVNRIGASTASLLFIIYSAVNGLTLSVVFLVYTQESIASTFLITGGTFAVVSIWGYTTKRDLTAWGSFLFMGLIGIIIASLVNLFLRSPMLMWMVTYLGVGIFVGLTAYDTQKLRKIASGQMDQEMASKASVLGALTLYLDFVNLFLLLLRIFGNRR